MSTLKDFRREVASSKVPTLDVMRKALILAHELEEPSLLKWVRSELNGYDYGEWTDDFPAYRFPTGVLMWRDEWGTTGRVQIQPSMEFLCRAPICDPISKLLECADTVSAGDTLDRPYNAAHSEMLQELTKAPFPLNPFLRYSGSQFTGIPECARSTLLDLILTLSKKFPDVNYEDPSPSEVDKISEQVRASGWKKALHWVDTNKDWVTKMIQWWFPGGGPH